MRAGRAIIVAAVLVAGCSGDGDDATNSTNDVTDGSTLDSTPSVPGSEPLFVPSDTGSEAVVDVGDGAAIDGERVTFDGVTFAYDPSQVGDVVPSRTAGDLTSANDASAPADVRFEFGATDSETSSLTVIALRDRQGGDYAELTQDRLAAALDVAAALDADTDSEGVVSFVNGSGIREVDGEGAYRFRGLTEDRRFLIDVEFDAQSGVDVDVLDGVVRSLFVDVLADALNGVACVDDAFFVSDETATQVAQIEPGAEFDKVWRFRNTGTCVWNEQYSFAFGGGTPMTVLDTAPIEITGPGEELNVTLRLQAPDVPGAYSAQWQLVDPTGLEIIGPPALLFINVPDVAGG